MPRAGRWIAAGLLWVATPAWTAEELVDGIAAQVGDRVVLISEVNRAVAAAEERMVDAGIDESEIAKLRADGLERMIEERLLEQEVQRLELYASDSEVDEVIAGIADENGISVEQLAANVSRQGLAFEDYREQIRNKVQQRKVMTAALAPKITIEPDEVQRLYYERFKDQPESGELVHLRQLLIPAGPGQDVASSCEAARAAAARIRAGEAFEVVAGEVSAVSPEHGGDIGWLHLDNLASWMSDLIESLEPGEVSDTAELHFGCTLLKLVERRAFEPMTYERAEDALMQEIYERKIEAEYSSWMEQLRERTYIKRRGYFADAARLDDPSAEFKSPASDSLLR